jgi:hypothetical protein
MTDYTCPTCTGGFPEDALDDGCPWCGQQLGEAEQLPPTRTSIVKRDDKERPTWLEKLTS